VRGPGASDGEQPVDAPLQVLVLLARRQRRVEEVVRVGDQAVGGLDPPHARRRALERGGTAVGVDHGQRARGRELGVREQRRDVVDPAAGGEDLAQHQVDRGPAAAARPRGG